MTIYIPGDPVGKERPRVANGHAYTPSKTKEYEERVAWAYKQAGGQMIEGAVQLTVIILKAIPKSTSKVKRGQMLNGDILPTQIPDIDNVLKSLMDGLQGVAFKNDSQVVYVEMSRFYDDQSGVFMEVVPYERCIKILGLLHWARDWMKYGRRKHERTTL